MHYGSVPQIDESNGLAGINDNKSRNELHRHLTLFDLVCVGVGATGELVLYDILHTQIFIICAPYMPPNYYPKYSR